MKNELIKITTNEKGKQTLSARELYDFLGLDKTHWVRWYKNNIINDDYFIENVDYIGYAIMANGNKTMDFEITVDMAKELCMLQRNEKGKQARRYFINCEKVAKQLIEENHKLELQVKENTILRLESENYKVSKVLQADRYISSEMYGEPTYITSIVINILKKCSTKGNILKSTEETYFINESPVREEFMKYRIKETEFKRYIEYFGGCKTKIKCNVKGGSYGVPIGCYSIPSFIIDWDMKDSLKRLD